jgi:hypothetical protein
LPASRQAAISERKWQAASPLKGPFPALRQPPMRKFAARDRPNRRKEPCRRRRGGQRVSQPGSTPRALRVCKARFAFQPCQIAPARDSAEGVGTPGVPPHNDPSPPARAEHRAGFLREAAKSVCHTFFCWQFFLMLIGLLGPLKYPRDRGSDRLPHRQRHTIGKRLLFAVDGERHFRREIRRQPLQLTHGFNRHR